MNPLLIAGAVGYAFSAYNSYMSLKESRKSKLEEQALRTREASEIAEKYKANINLTERKGLQEISNMSGGRASFYASESSLALMTERYSNLIDNISNMRKEADYAVSMRLREADIAGSQAAAYNRATLPTAIGGALQTAGAFGKATG